MAGKLFTLLRSALPKVGADRRNCSVVGAFGSFYHSLYHHFSANEFSFLRQAFEEFLIGNWTGQTIGKPRWLENSSRNKLRWCALSDARSELACADPMKLLSRGDIRGTSTKKESHTVIRIDRASIQEWKERNALAINRVEVGRILGLSFKTVMRIVNVGCIRPSETSDSFYYAFNRNDVLSILETFELNQVPEVPSWNHETDIPFGLAIRSHALDLPYRFLCVWNAIMKRRLLPIARLAETLASLAISFLDKRCRGLGS
jgi:hypothetical protein